MVFFACGVGGIICGYLSDIYGRLLPVNLSGVGIFIFAFLCINVVTYNEYLFYRSMVGFFIGLYTVDSTIISEICPRSCGA